MNPSGGSGSQLMTTLVTFILIAIPIAIINAKIARRKGKRAALYGWLSIIPFVGYFIAIYLVSLTDKELLEKVDMILDKLNAAKQETGSSQ